MHGCSGGVACMVAPGGACMVALGGHAWLFPLGGHAWLLWGGMRGIRRDTEIRSMSGRYTSYWNVFLFKLRMICNLFRYFAFACALPKECHLAIRPLDIYLNRNY